MSFFQNKVTPGQAISAKDQNALRAEVERLGKWSVAAPLQLLSGPQGFALSAVGLQGAALAPFKINDDSSLSFNNNAEATKLDEDLEPTDEDDINLDGRFYGGWSGAGENVLGVEVGDTWYAVGCGRTGVSLRLTQNADEQSTGYTAQLWPDADGNEWIATTGSSLWGMPADCVVDCVWVPSYWLIIACRQQTIRGEIQSALERESSTTVTSGGIQFTVWDYHGWELESGKVTATLIEGQYQVIASDCEVQ